MIEFTGEQFVPEVSSKRMQDDHLQRYRFASRFVADKDILDVACGAGYGSVFLKEHGGAKSVLGVDISSDVVKSAIEKYKRDGVDFAVGDLANFNPGRKFDTIVSFETIEHVDDYKSALSNLYNLLNDGGNLIISTPNRPVTSPYARTLSDKPRNPYHVREFAVSEIVSALRGVGFEVSSHNIYGQRQQYVFKNRIINRIYKRIFKPDVRNSPKVELLTKEPRFIVIVATKSGNPENNQDLKTSGFYEDYWKLRGKSKFRPRFKTLADWISPKSNVLEIGCGDGFFADMIKRLKDVNYHGADLSSQAIGILKERGLDGEVLDASKDLGRFADNSFDFVVMSEFIEHVQNSEEVLLHASRIAKRGVLVTVPNIAYWKWRLQLLYGIFPKQYAVTPSEHVRFWSVFDFIEMVEKLGLLVKEYKSSNGKKYLRDWWPNLFGFQVCFFIDKK